MSKENETPGPDRGYKSLCTEFYDLTKPLASGEEVKFYKEKLENKKILDVRNMCESRIFCYTRKYFLWDLNLMYHNSQI